MVGGYNHISGLAASLWLWTEAFSAGAMMTVCPIE